MSNEEFDAIRLNSIAAIDESARAYEALKEHRWMVGLKCLGSGRAPHEHEIKRDRELEAEYDAASARSSAAIAEFAAVWSAAEIKEEAA